MLHITDTPVFRAVHALLHLPVPLRLVFYVTGAAAGLQQDLWQVPGSSSLIVSGVLPYEQAELSTIISRPVGKALTEEMAISMARRAYDTSVRAMKAANKEGMAIGLGATAAVATEKDARDGKREDRKGHDEIFVAVRLVNRVLVAHVRFHKTHELRPAPATKEEAFRQRASTRNAQGEQCDLIALNLILCAAGLEQIPLSSFLIKEGDIYESGRKVFISPRTIPCNVDPGTLYDRPLFWPDGRRGGLEVIDPSKHLVMPTSGNPLHRGHEAIADATERITGKRVVFQLTQHHPDKGILTYGEMASRVEQFGGKWPVLLMHDASRYIDKARELPGVGLVLGADTVERLLNPDYYSGEMTVEQMLQEFRDLGTRFYVVGRTRGDKFITLRDIALPEGYADLFEEIPGRWDISSTAIRSSGQTDA